MFIPIFFLVPRNSLCFFSATIEKRTSLLLKPEEAIRRKMLFSKYFKLEKKKKGK
jgi:hypothetical protein